MSGRPQPAEPPALSPWSPAAAALAGRVLRYDELDSTSDEARRLADRGEAPPLLVIARRQTAGRGRRENRWWSSAGSLTFSLLLAPSRLGLGPADYGRFSLAAALAVCDAADAFSPGALRVKWPNDVVALRGAGFAKVAGVLLESPSPDRLVVGIGVNAATRMDDAPPDVRAASASVAEVVARPIDPESFLGAVLAALADRVAQLASGSPAPQQDWNARSALTGRAVAVDRGGAGVEGVCRGLGDDGALMLECNGETTRVASGAVRWIGPPS